MAALKRSDSKDPKKPPPRSCVACCGDEDECQLVRPCRGCNADYCTDCLIDMFESASFDRTRMPPRCCHLIQIHTIVRHLTPKQATEYRASFEEWITPVKTYCPSPTCSAFIPERQVPVETAAIPIPSVQSVMKDVLQKVSLADCARFFRGELDITELPGFTSVVKRHVDLGMMQANIDRYSGISDVTADMRLLVSNALEYNGEEHPVTDAARRLFYQYTEEISKATESLFKATALPPTPQIFPCPKCHVAMCTKCKLIEHTGKPCDTSAADHELAMLESFGYKRCPRCKAGVKKMFGCSHMQCVCGAHWCYWCQRSITECTGECEERENEEAEDDEYDSEAVEQSDEMLETETRETEANVQTGTGSVASEVNASPGSGRRLVNLDGGGERRWAANGQFDFGDEPEEEPFSQVWSCQHSFQSYEMNSDEGFNRGDLDRMECNRCFDLVVARKLPQPKRLISQMPRRKFPLRTKGLAMPKEASIPDEDVCTKSNEAMECSRCRIVVCPACKDKYQATEGS